MCRHSVLPGVLKITYSLFGIGTSASRERHGIIYPFPFSMCCCHSLVPINGEEKTEEKKKKSSGGLVVWLPLAVKGFFFLYCMKSQTPAPLHLPALPAAWQQEDSCYLHPPCSRATEEGKKKPWHSKNVNVAISLHSALKKGIRSETVTEGNPRGWEETQQFW